MGTLTGKTASVRTSRNLALKGPYVTRNGSGRNGSGLCRKALCHQLGEGAGTMADSVLGRGLHLAERQSAALGQKHRVVTETARAPGRPNQRPIHTAFEGFDMAIRPGQRKGA